MLRSFVIRFLVFSLPLAGLYIAMEWFQRQIPNNYSVKKQQFEAGLHQWETLVLGSSHTYLGINPDSLPGPGYNLGATAQTLYFDRFLLEKYMDDMPRLKRVIIPISYPSLGGESDRNPGIYDKSYHYAFFYGSEAFTDWYAPKRYSIVQLFGIKRCVDRAKAYYVQPDTLVEFEANGWMATDVQHDLERNGAESGLFHDQVYDTSLVALNLQRLGDMITRCQARNIAVYLLSPPMWESYLAHTRPERLDRMVHAMDSLSEHYAVPYINFTSDKRFIAEDFFDSNHLRRDGANKLSVILREYMEQPRDPVTYFAKPVPKKVFSQQASPPKSDPPAAP
ncbi:MAG: hypothetical protein AAFV07_03950 [Bacteroidota bacterium]